MGPLADGCVGWLRLGTLTGYYAHNKESPVILGILPHGFTIGLQKEF